MEDLELKAMESGDEISELTLAIFAALFLTNCVNLNHKWISYLYLHLHHRNNSYPVSASNSMYHFRNFNHGIEKIRLC